MQKKVALFLDRLSEHGSIRKACKQARIDRKTIYTYMAGDAAFQAQVRQAKEMGVDALEDEATERGFNGSDVLLIFRLKSERPEKYRERTRDEPLPPVDWDRVSEADQVAFIEGKISLADVITRQQPRH